MRSEEFESRPEFQHFKEVMKGILSVSKKRLDELVHEARDESPRKGNLHAPGKKRVKRKSKPRSS